MCKRTFNLALILMGILACSVSADLVGYWSFDEGAGTVANDGSGNDNHGEVVGGAQWVAGKVGGALAFDGSDDMVVIEQNIGLPIYNNGTDNVWSIAMWVKGAPQNDMRVFSEASTANNNPLFNLGTKNNGATGQLDCYIRPTGMGHTFSDAEPFDDTWHHIAWVDAD
ncbi:MAG: LamG domain-containing protein, partial [Planctomycetes bacterium]|nr:LamG domain-containing protein [Planctomycetota bacterium]